MWMRAKDAGGYLGVSRDTIERRALAWQDEPVKGRIRFKLLQLEGEPVRRYFKADVDALLRNPLASSGAVSMVPRFV